MDRVYVGNLPPHIRIKDIDDFFRPFGNLEYIDVNHRANPVYALVQFDNPRNAFMAVKSRHGYNFEGYTLQLRLVESEVRKRRDPTPPPPPPSMFNNDYAMQNNRGGGFGNNYDNFNNNNFNNNNNRMGQNYPNSSASSSFQSSQWGSFDNYNNRSNMSQYSSNHRMNTGQQNMMDYSSNNRSNMSYSSSSGRSNMSQPNMMSFSNENQSNMMNYSHNYSNNNNNWGNNDFGRGSYGGGNNAGGNNNFNYNANQDPYTNVNFEDNYTRGLSGAGRKWFNRYIREGYSAEAARAKALERRTVPYMRDDPKAKLAAVNPTNAALENIGTTLISLLSSTAADNFNSGNQMMPSGSNWGGDYDMPGPSRGRGEARNAVSKQQYLKSLNILKRLRGRGSRDAKDRLSKKYHTQIVNDYERYQKQSSRNERDGQNASSSSADGKSYTQLLVAFKKKKQQLLVAARKMGKEVGSNQSGAFRSKMRMLMKEGDFPRIEAKALAVHPVAKLKILMEMKADYEKALKRKQEKFAPLKEAARQNSARYRSDLNYLKRYENSKVEKLSESIQLALRTCLNRIHRHEKEGNLPLTKTKFDLLPSKTRLRGRRVNGRRGGSGRRGTRRGEERKAIKKAQGKTDGAKEKPTDENIKDEGQQEHSEDNENATEEHDDGNNQDAIKAE